MKYWIIMGATVLSISLSVATVVQRQEQQRPQQPQEPPRHDKYKDDEGAYCWNPASSGSQVKTRERDPHAHKCECHLMCMIGPDNQPSNDQETPNCELYCTRSHCTCHVEEPCEMPKHEASNRSTYPLRQADLARQLKKHNISASH